MGDIKSGKVVTPELYLIAAEAEHFSDEQLLRSKDILISKSGTIGKIGIVSPEKDGNVKLPQCVAGKNLIVIRPSEEVLPEYLVELLRAKTYQEWMGGHAHGSVIQHLSIRTLQHLPVVVPDLLLQKRVISFAKYDSPVFFEDLRPDCMDVLLRLTSKVNHHFTIQQETKRRQREVERISKRATDNPLELLGKIASVLDDHRESDKELPEWWNAWWQALEGPTRSLRGIQSLERGPGLYAVLQDAKAQLSQAQSILDSTDISSEERQFADELEKLAGAMQVLVIRSTDSLLAESELRITLSDATVAIGQVADLQLKIRNLGQLPLRDVVINTDPDFGSHRIPYFSESSEQSVTLSIPAQLQPGNLGFRVRWTAMQLDSNSLQGSTDLAIDVQSIRRLATLSDFGSNPYITGNPVPVDRQEMLYGRADVIAKIKRQLMGTSHANVILLEGNRRTGKTSILYHLTSDKVLPGWLPVYCSFQRAGGHPTRAGVPTHQVFKRMAVSIGTAAARAGIRTWFPGREMPLSSGLTFESEFQSTANNVFSGDDPFDAFDLYLQAVLQAILPNRLLLMLDEFHKLQEGIENKVTSPQVPENIRSLLHAHPRLSAILSYSTLFGRLRAEYWSMLFGLGHPIHVGALTFDDAGLLVTQPAEGKLVFAEKARDRIVELCAGQPYLIQRLCNHIFEGAAETGERTVSEQVVKEAAAIMAADNEHFKDLWDNYVGTDRRRYILVLCVQLQDSPDPINLKMLELKLEEAGIIVRGQRQLGEDSGAPPSARTA